jgi:hypothetical protein
VPIPYPRSVVFPHIGNETKDAQAQPNQQPPLSLLCAKVHETLDVQVDVVVTVDAGLDVGTTPRHESNGRGGCPALAPSQDSQAFRNSADLLHPHTSRVGRLSVLSLPVVRKRECNAPHGT